jgi:uracil-DNA glycosylase
MERCAAWLDATFTALPDLRVVVCLGRIAFTATLALYQRRGWIKARSGLDFAHGQVHQIPPAPAIVCSYHPSQQNTFTGRLTRPMLLRAMRTAAELADRHH